MYPSVAFKSENAILMNALGDYTYIWNALHYPSGTVPITHVRPLEANHYEDSHNDLWTKAIRKDI